ncbi:COPI-interacting protein CEX1 TDEL_0F01200 [Torulaspora delbrueckii]|uniref:Protein kinase domain-containing protein n=1 Tax=Torulaspora delbrueckii TaxID=4950 RepID=G8ZWD7_TORDE|nr:hypothetical protein TDEL_0F01200 [Torulaspora delbrueckii]CCE92931.1 hypothetical protein TDEL_0F01200 [Torulaspora delbrueckii]
MSFINLFKSLSNFQFPFTLEDKPVSETTLWQVFNGLRKSDSVPVTVFKANRSQQTEALITNAIHKAKILKIPGLCRVLETFDSDPQSTFIVTERVTPFPWDDIATLQRNKEALELGISQLLTTLTFLNAFVLGTIGKDSIFIDSKGQWLLFGLEMCSKVTDISNPERYLDSLHDYNRLLGLSSSCNNLNKIDAMSLGSLITTIFGTTAKIPKDWQSPVQSLASGRTSIENFMNKLQLTDTWLSNPLITIYQQLKELHIKEPQEKLAVMTNLQTSFFENKDLYHNLSAQFVEGLVIPEIANVIKWLMTSQNNSTSAVSRIIPLLAIYLDLSTERQYFPENSKQLIYDCFGLPDRQIRFLLLIYLPKISKHLNKGEISTKIYPRFIQGMADADATLRLQTLKRVPIVVPFITERQLNNELLRFLAKTQVDAEVEIRTWTVIIITRISTLLSTSSGNRSNILATAFTKSLKDPVTKPRLAALYGLAKSIDLFDVATIANKILTVIAPGLLDKDPLVRSKAKGLFEKYLNKLEDEAKAIQSANSGSHSEDINFDQYGEEETSDDTELVNQFMATLMLSSTPEPDLLTKNNTVEDNGWDTQDQDLDDGGLDTASEKINQQNAFKSTPVPIEKSWNDELNEELDDGWDDQSFWEESQPKEPPKPVIKTVKKTSILATKRPTGAIRSSRSSSTNTKVGFPAASVPKNKPVKNIFKETEVIVNDEDTVDDSWDGEW